MWNFLSNWTASHKRQPPLPHTQTHTTRLSSSLLHSTLCGTDISIRWPACGHLMSSCPSSSSSRDLHPSRESSAKFRISHDTNLNSRNILFPNFPFLKAFATPEPSWSRLPARHMINSAIYLWFSIRTKAVTARGGGDLMELIPTEPLCSPDMCQAAGSSRNTSVRCWRWKVTPPLMSETKEWTLVLIVSTRSGASVSFTRVCPRRDIIQLRRNPEVGHRL